MGQAVPGSGGDDRLYGGRGVGAGTAEVLYYLHGALGSVVGLANANGDLVEKYEYDPYGRTYITAPDGTARPVSAYGNPFAWTGQRYDRAVRLYHFWARSYSPALGRWLQRDPLGYVDGVGLYEYVGGSATEATDPLGLLGAHDVIGYPWPRNQQEREACERACADCAGAGVVPIGGILAVVAAAAPELVAGAIAWVQQNPAKVAEIGNTIAEALMPEGGPATSYLGSRGYRAVSQAEWDDLVQTGQFRGTGRSVDGKYFTLSEGGADTFGKIWYPDGNYGIVGTDIPGKTPVFPIGEPDTGIGHSIFVDGSDLWDLEPIMIRPPPGVK